MKYGSSITRTQFKVVRSLLEKARKKTKPRKLDLYDVFNGLMYVIKTGCQWRELPNDFPDYRSVHAYFRIWSKIKKEQKESILAQVLKKISRERAYQKWQKALYDHGYRRRPECEEYRYRSFERL